MRRPVAVLLTVLAISGCGTPDQPAARAASDPWAGFSNGGFPADYRPTPYDRRLTLIAQAMLPLHESVESFRETNGRLPADRGQLRLPTTIRSGSRDARVGYVRRDAGYELSVVLGWDPVLILRVDGGDRRWVFAPGDGSADVDVLLEPRGSAAPALAALGAPR